MTGMYSSTFDTNGLVVREAAACGLASVLIEGSCAAEDVTDGRNGFKIEESADAMADFLKEAVKDLDHIHDVGQHAMDEIYMNWRDAVSVAYARYQYVIEQYKKGAFVNRQKDITDAMVSATARNMEEQALSRQIRHDIFNDFKDTAIGMMDNIQENTSNFGALLSSIGDEIVYDSKKNRQKFRENIDKIFGN